MNTGFFKNSFAAAIGVVAITAATTVATTSGANAGSRDFWAGAGAGFITGVIVDRATRHHHGHYHAAPRHTAWDAHVAWCYDRYLTYTHVTDTYMSTAGYRKKCYSPYY